jgi:hypothetical protein
MTAEMIFRRKRRDLDARVKSAEAEKKLSEARLANVRENIIEPLQETASRNHFADLLRSSIFEGYGRKHGHNGGERA